MFQTGLGALARHHILNISLVPKASLQIDMVMFSVCCKIITSFFHETLYVSNSDALGQSRSIRMNFRLLAVTTTKYEFLTGPLCSSVIGLLGRARPPERLHCSGEIFQQPCSRQRSANPPAKHDMTQTLKCFAIVHSGTLHHLFAGLHGGSTEAEPKPPLQP